MIRSCPHKNGLYFSYQFYLPRVKTHTQKNVKGEASWTKHHPQKERTCLPFSLFLYKTDNCFCFVVFFFVGLWRGRWCVRPSVSLFECSPIRGGHFFSLNECSSCRYMYPLSVPLYRTLLFTFTQQQENKLGGSETSLDWTKRQSRYCAQTTPSKQSARSWCISGSLWYDICYWNSCP